MKNLLESLPNTIGLGIVLTIVLVILVKAIN